MAATSGVAVVGEVALSAADHPVATAADSPAVVADSTAAAHPATGDEYDD
jgi:hypothetical protein